MCASQGINESKKQSLCHKFMYKMIFLILNFQYKYSPQLLLTTFFAFTTNSLNMTSSHITYMINAFSTKFW